MALIYCPGCGKSISDQASVCPHCGAARERDRNDFSHQIQCRECDNYYDKDLEACPVCGCPTPRQKPKKKRKWPIILLIILGIIVAAGAILLNSAKQVLYYENMEYLTYTMLDGAADAETASNLIRKVWSNAIWEESDEETDKFTKPDGVFVSDFNDALSNLFNDETFISDLAKIKENQDECRSLMKEMLNPPKKYEEAYAALKIYYDNYIEMTNMALNPTGSLESFSNDFNEIDEETVKSFEKMKLYID